MKYYFLFILFWVAGSGFGQKSKFTTSTDRTKILIGEPFQLTLKAFVSGNQYRWPVIDSIPHFEVLSRQKPDSQLNNGTLVLNQVITLTSWDSGRWVIPSFTIDGSSKSAPLLMAVVYAPFDTAQEYHDVKDIMEAAKLARPQWHWYLVGALLLALLFVLMFPRTKAKKEVAFMADAGIYKQSLMQLERLKKEGSKDAGVLYTELIQIFRTYLLKRKGIYSHAKTTGDLAVQLKQLGIAPNTFEALLQTLGLSDMVKFARQVPDEADNVVSFESVRQGIIAIENLK